MIYTVHVLTAIGQGADDTALNELIAQIEDVTDVSQWRVANYIHLRLAGYPPMAEYLDAQVKIAAGGSLALEGQDQLDKYNQKCLSVKYRFPKI